MFYAIQNIKTMQQGCLPPDSVDPARKMLKEATRIYFLGFGFHPQNLALLHLRHSSSGKQISGTSRGLSKQRKLLANDHLQLGGWEAEKGNFIKLFDSDVYDFLHDHAEL